MDPQWDENRWAWDHEEHPEELRAARHRLVTVLHRQASRGNTRESAATQVRPAKDAGPFWRRWWQSLTEGP